MNKYKHLSLSMKNSMQELKAITRITACWMVISIATAQDRSDVFINDVIELTDEQFDQIQEVESQFNEEIKILEKDRDEVIKRITAKHTEYENKRLGLLTSDQKSVLTAERRKRQEEEYREVQSREIEHLKKLLPILEKLRSTESISILEGPQRTGKDLPTALNDQSVVHVGKHFFFAEPLALSRDDEISALATMSSYKSFGAYLEGKFCGGFHPDANIQLLTKHGTVQALLCFGCQEVKFIDGENHLMVEVETDAYRILRDLCLRNFRHRVTYKGSR